MVVKLDLRTGYREECFGAKRNEVTASRRKLHDKEIESDIETWRNSH
jgi:hypothetical protein